LSIQQVNSNHIKGIALLLAAMASFSVLDTIAKRLTQSNPAIMVAWARYAFHLLLMVIFLWPKRGTGLIRSKRLSLQFGRGLLLGVSTITFFTSLSKLPLADAAGIAMVAPILVSVVAVWLLKETPPPGTWLALACSLVGVMLIIRPGGSDFTWYLLLPVASAICFAGYQLTTRVLANDAPVMTTLFLGAVSATLLLCLVVPFFWQWPSNPWDILGFVAMGAIGAFGHSLLIKAYSYAPASTLAPYIYMQIVLALLFGWMVFGHFPDQWAMLGMLIVTLSGLLLALASRYRSREFTEPL
jgi:drug/metabolite transporter (DMT)-like permease